MKLLRTICQSKKISQLVRTTRELLPPCLFLSLTFHRRQCTNSYDGRALGYTLHEQYWYCSRNLYQGRSTTQLHSYQLRGHGNHLSILGT